MDVYTNIDSPDFNLSGIIITYEKDTYEFIVEGVCNKELTLPPPDIDSQERMIHDTRHYKDFLDGDLDYKFEYRINGREGTYVNMNALMLAL